MRPLHPFLSRPSRHRVLAVAALLAQVVAVTGAPLPVAREARSGTAASAPYPCRDHVCGCASAEQCWAGDCCCYTLEEKLRWADAHAVEPPAHVRPAVEARASATRPPTAAEPCCAEAVRAKSARSEEHACCQAAAAGSTPPNHLDAAHPDGQHPGEPVHQGVEPGPDAGDQPGVDRPAPSIRWVAGFMAQRCRGEGTTGLLKLDPAVPPTPGPRPPGSAQPGRYVRLLVLVVATPSPAPPTPPPRFSSPQV